MNSAAMGATRIPDTIKERTLTHSEEAAVSRELRKALGTFVTGITVVATRSREGAFLGLTANSFTSVSLSPPLILVCIGREKRSARSLLESGHFAISVLSNDQQHACQLFASRRNDKFEAVSWRADINGSPILEGSHAWFSCSTYKTVEAGDHLIMVGRILDFGRERGRPLAYYSGAFADVEPM